MAGFLGTLFMGNVGLRLLLPPKSAYGKMAADFGNSAKKIGQIGQKEHKKSLDRQTVNTRTSLFKAQSLLATARKTNAQEDILALRTELKHLDTLTNGAIGKLAQKIGLVKDTGNIAALGTASVDSFDEIMGMMDDSGVPQFTDAMEALGDQISGMVTGALDRFNQSLQFSTMALITIGFQTQMAARSLIEYEKELVNANSIFQVSNDELYSISNEVVNTGLEYALTYDNMSSALYQFASAGLDAAESQKILADVMKLSMAVQGDSETIGKLMIQTIKGFGLEFSDSAMLADQFAFAINKSLLEYQDLASAVKFAMPFFVSTNQEIEQLLGGLAILTDRALEAGIAGRGLRQALAELAESLGDNTRKFQEMGINITDAEGNLLQMTEIAMEFNKHFGAAANDTELLTTLISDLNVRGATAFVHLVQNAEEYAQVTEEIANASGTATEMADKQMESLSNQIQITKNAIIASFLYAEVQEDGTLGVNSFHQSILDLVQMVRSKFVTQMEDGRYVLTEFAFALRDTATKFMVQFSEVLEKVLDTIVNLSSSSFNLVEVMELLFIPLKMIVNIMDAIPDSIQPTVIQFFLLSRMVGFTGAAFILGGSAIRAFFVELAGGSSILANTIGVILALAGAMAIIGAVALPFINPALAAVISPTLLSFGTGSLAIGGGMLLGSGGDKPEDSATGDYMSAYDSYIESTSGFDLGPTSGAGGATTLNVGTANFRTDNLDETFYSSQYTT